MSKGKHLKKKTPRTKKKAGAKSKAPVRLAVKILAVLVLLALVFALFLLMTGKDKGGDGAASGDPGAAGSPVVSSGVAEDGGAEDSAAKASPVLTTAVLASSPLDGYDLGGGLAIVRAGRYAGYFVEDGSDELVADVFALTVENTSDAMLEYAQVTVTVSGEHYVFDISSLPAGAKAQALESGKKTLPADLSEASAELTLATGFASEPTMYPELFSVTATDYGISVENISGADISGDIYVYYKTLSNGLYMGGITYRARIDGGLAAGETKQCYAGHFLSESSALLFVTYVP